MPREIAMDGRFAEPVPESTELLELIHFLSDALESHYDWLWATQRLVVCSEGAVASASCRLDAGLAMAHAVPHEASGVPGSVPGSDLRPLGEDPKSHTPAKADTNAL